MITTYISHLYRGRHCIQEFNPDLFLALCAMTDKPEGIPGEYWMYTWENTEDFTKNKIYKQVFSDEDGDNYKNFTKATKEEIINHFKPIKMKKEISIPQGTKATMYQNGDKVIIEYDEKFEPKPGDVCINFRGSIFILKKMCKNGAEPYIGFLGDKTFTDGEFYAFGIRLADKEERTEFFERLVKEGYKWDSKKLKLTKKWVPNTGDFVVDNDGVVCIYHSTNESGGIISFAGVGNHVTTTTYHGWGYTKNFKPANENQKQALLDAMHSAGKDWDAVNKKVVDYKWKPEMGEIYYVPNPLSFDFYTILSWDNDTSDNTKLGRGLVFKTKEESISRAKQMLNTK